MAGFPARRELSVGLDSLTYVLAGLVEASGKGRLAKTPHAAWGSSLRRSGVIMAIPSGACQIDRGFSRLDRRQRTWQAGERRGRTGARTARGRGLGLLRLDQRRAVEVDRAEAVAGGDVVPGGEPVGQLLDPLLAVGDLLLVVGLRRVRPSPWRPSPRRSSWGRRVGGEALAGSGSSGVRRLGSSASALGSGISAGSNATVTIK